MKFTLVYVYEVLIDYIGADSIQVGIDWESIMILPNQK